MKPADAIKMMKEHKIIHLRLPDGLELTLSPEAFAAPAADVKADPVDEKHLDERGSSGMTRREQLELLGTTFEADWKK